MPTVPERDVYAWFESGRRPAYYTLMFARGLSPGEALGRLAAPDPVRALTEAERRVVIDPRDLVDAHDLGEWCLVVELDGFDAYVATAVDRLSAGTEVVMLTYNVLAHCRFRHVVDGTTWTCFDASDPSDRGGLHPDRLTDAMRRVGLDPDHDPDDTEKDEPLNWNSKTAALAESVTGIRLTPKTFTTTPTFAARIAFTIGA